MLFVNSAGQSEGATFAVEACYRFPLALGRSNLSAVLEVWLHLERQAGTLTQGKVIRSVTLPPNGSIQLTSADQARFILDEDGFSVFRCEGLPAEDAYMQSMRRGLEQLGMRTPDGAEAGRADNTIVLDAGPISFPFLPAMLQSLVDRAEVYSRWSEAIARRAQRAVRGPVGRSYTRTFTNPNGRRSLTLFFYHADKYQLVRCRLSRIDRMVEAVGGMRAASPAHAEATCAAIDQQLSAADLLDAQGQVTPAAQQLYSWQHSFRLPTPHVLVRSHPLDTAADSSIFEAAKIRLLPQSL
jgi:hypothetical protein